ncbi:outer membrane assembly lipoprotein YfgL [Mycolicibacterium fortuitum]|uniref:Outer membrane assembly lipoprotein YfgL n=1 Tax=Mycolicibacterium fortuitum TaxID=1766 RepID=A0A378UY19_MYCFO|nr:outer membrane assembly lipoprotein YfgL [Mycolicibacterium fortuitum]
MSDVTDSADDERESTVTRAGRLAIALAIGMTVGAVGLAGYAYVARVPAGQTATYLAPAGHLLLVSLIGVLIAAAATGWLCARALAGLDTAGHASLLLAAIVAVAAYGLLAAKSSQLTLLISGPGARPVIAIAQVSWAVLACAALLLLAGATSASPGPVRRPGRVAVGALAVTGVVLAAVAGVVVTSLSPVGVSTATTAERGAIPAVPTSVGAQVAYTVKLDSTVVLPAGPGFVSTNAGAVVAFDGTTGAQRWRVPTADLPERCGDVSLWSTGIGDDAVVVVQCTRPPNTADPDRYSSDRDDYVAFLLGLDAMTGEQLWVNDTNWHVQGRAQASDVLAVVSPSQIGALDARIGKTLWTKDRPDDDCSRSRYDVVDSKLIFVDACGDAMHIYDADSEATIDLTEQPGFPSGDVTTDLLAADGSVAVVYANEFSSIDGVLLSVDVQTKAVQATPQPYVRTANAGSLLPGPVVEIRTDSGANTVTLYVPAERRAVPVTGLGMSVDPGALRWARVGDEFVTAAAYQSDSDEVLATVPVTGGQATLKPHPCHREASVVPVPGAVLTLCPNRSGSGNISGYDVLGLR